MRFSSITLGVALSLAALGAPAALAAGAEGLEPSPNGMFSVDATVMHDATPDYIGLGVLCEMQTAQSRPDARADITKKLAQIKTIVGTDGKVRLSGSPTLYPAYMDPMMGGTQTFTGNVSFSVREVKPAASQKISEAIEDMGCTVNWDVRLIYVAKYAREQKKELMEQIQEKKEFYESILGTKLNKVNSMSFYTSPDGGYYGGYSIYDPETNTVPAQTTLSITFDLGTAKN